MYRAPVRSQRSPGGPRPEGRFPSPASCWGFPGTRSPFGGSPRGVPAHSPRSPVFSPSSYRGCWDGSPSSAFGSGPRGSGRSGGAGAARGFGGQNWRRGGGFRRPQSFSPASAHSFQSESSDAPVEKYFSPSMLQDPWAALQPVAAADRRMS